MSKRDAHEHEVSLTFKYAYRPSLLRREEASISPHASQTNLGVISSTRRPPVCSPSSLPLRQDAIFQSFPSPSSSRNSPKRSPATGRPSRSVLPQQAIQIQSPRPSPRGSPHGTPQNVPTPAEKEDVNWAVSETETPLTFQFARGGIQSERYAKPSGTQVSLLDGGGSLKNPESHNSNKAESIDQEESTPKWNGGNSLGKQAAILGHYPQPPRTSPTGSNTNGKESSPSTSGSASTTGDNTFIPRPPMLRRRRPSSFLHFIRSPLTFPVRGQTGKGLIYACIPRNSRKISPSTGVPGVSSPHEMPNNRIYRNNGNHSPPAKTPTPIELSNVSTHSSSLKQHRHGEWRGKKKSKSPVVELKETTKPREDSNSCYVGGEAFRYRTPLESPRIAGTPPTPSTSTAISPRTVNLKGKALPSYFDLHRRGTSNISPLSPNDRGFTLMPLSDTNLLRREDSMQTQAAILPHFVQVPMFSRAAPFAQREDYGGHSGDASPVTASRRSSFPPGSRRGWSNRSSAVFRVPDGGRRASFGYRDHMNFITKPDGYSSREGSSGKQPSNTNSSRTGSGSSEAQKKDGTNMTESSSRKGSLGERRASKVIAAMNASRKNSSEKTTIDGNGNSTHSAQSSSKMVHWRGAEVTEEEAKVLDMLVGKHRLFSEMLMAPFDSSQTEGSEKPPEPGEGPVSILRRPSWRRFASTIGSPPLSGLSEETGSSDRTPKPEAGDGVPDARELYAEALKQTLGIPIGAGKRKNRREDTIEKAPTLPPALVDQMKPKDFITAPADLKRTDTPPGDSGTNVSRSTRTTTRTEYETEILSIAMLYGRVIKETTGPASEPVQTPSINEDSARPPSRAPSLTVPERPSVSFITNALDERSQSDSLMSDVRRVSLNPQSKSRRSSSTVARLQKLANAVTGGGENMSKRHSTTSPLSSPPEYTEDNKPRHQSLNVPSLVAALRSIRGNSTGRDKDKTATRLGSTDDGRSQGS
ncbi:hypothetical protein H072_1141 [Dactylellina haptotyla CBS 200.50]|uniref:Uncharacterized protein n=1 Tax=Dactylellina haptotyla (strain CBS 200.50) TaxID=1284197 RepID=S8APK6_DACHA|nr:hypothetical protein H072_1141 [Dactylellina haptotyla CBS 200.50]